MTAASGAVVKGYGSLPLVFEPNRGQTSSLAKFLARASGYDVFITADKAVFRVGTASVGMRLAGAKKTAKPEALAPLASYSNYILGNDPSHWLQGVPHFAKVRVAGVLPGVDLTYYGEGRRLEYDLDVAPGADTRSLELKFDGAQGLSLDADGNLLIHTASGDVVQHRPVTSQGRNSIRAEYALLRDGGVAIRVGAYDHKQALKIDPVLSYSTYLSGSLNDVATAMAVDSTGSVAVTGYTNSLDFPVTNGTTNRGQTNVFVTKLNSSGSGLIYSTYIGGSSIDKAYALAVDPAGNVYLTGTGSPDFPVIPSGTSPLNGGSFVCELDSSGELVYSRFVPGYGNPNGMAVDSQGNVYMVGETGETIPTTPGAFQVTRPTSFLQDAAFVIKVDSSGQVVYGTYLSGTSGTSSASAVNVDVNGNAFVVGSTTQSDFPVTAGSFSGSFAGATDAFALKLNATGSALLYSTYLGGSAIDSANAVVVDTAGNAYITGTTESSDFPTTPGTLSPTAALVGNETGFVTKLNASGSALTYSTFLGDGVAIRRTEL